MRNGLLSPLGLPYMHCTCSCIPACPHSCSHGLKEDECRFFFQQLILALDYCHKMGVLDCGIILENTLLAYHKPSRRPLIKLCFFGYSINDPTIESYSLANTAGGAVSYTGACCIPGAC